MIDLTVVILTFNEEINLPQCLSNVRGFARDVFIVDSLSTDRTLSVAAEHGVRVFEHPFRNYADQRNWALRELPYRTEWMVFLDADELLSDGLKREIEKRLPQINGDVCGIEINRRFFWMGKWIRHGDVYPCWLLRLVRHAKAYCDDRTVNEHIRVDGKVIRFEGDLDHKDLRDLSDWARKHMRYADLEAGELVRAETRRASGEAVDSAKFLGTQSERKRWLREKVWNRLLPPLVRPFLYFIYRYFLKLGFLDGREGLIYHFLQGLWFPFLIDVHYVERKRKARREGEASCAASPGE